MKARRLIRLQATAFCPLPAPLRPTPRRPRPRNLCTRPPVASSDPLTPAQRNRLRGVGVPKGLDTGPPRRQLTADESPWEDYLVPTLEGNASPSRPERYLPGGEPFYVLGVETSCDDTAAAVVSSTGEILGDAREGQDAQTAAWGGVVPDVAREAHEAAIGRVVESALKQAGMELGGMHAVAATMGPGLEVCLRVGYRAARAAARECGAEFVGVNHLEAHVLAARIEEEVPFPFLSLLVSGGHCQLLLVRGVADYAALGGTLDDALGEAYDKTARLLGLPLSGGGGGPALERAALEGDPDAVPFPVPMRKRADCNFSFAGLKTSVRTAVRRLGGVEKVKKDPKIVADVAASFQHTAVCHLEDRVRRALRRCKGVRHLVVAGGVAANLEVRGRLTRLAESEGVQARFPRLGLCTDNGVMVAWTGVERLREGMATDFECMDVRARWPLARLMDVEKETGVEGVVGVEELSKTRV